MKWIFILLASLIITGCEGKTYEDKTNDNISIIVNSVPVYSDTYLKDIMTLQSDVKVISENYKIDTNSLGEKKLKVYFKKDKKNYVYNYVLNVIDGEMPKVFSGTNKTVYVGYEGDLCNLITYGDNYTGDVKCEITGEYDLNKAGTYKLLYTLSDSSNNKKEVNVTVNVIEKPKKDNNSKPSTPEEAPKKEFADVINEYKTDNNEFGIDVSKWQENIDFEKVKNAGASFVMMRIGVQKEALGDLSMDAYFEQNYENAKKAGLKVGVYLYSIATSSKEAIKQANWVIKKLDGKKIDLPIVFDWENWTKWNSYKISFHEINEIADNFMDRIKKKGYEGMLYSSKFYLETIWTNKKEFPVWLAHYTSKTNYEGDYQIWQLCNNGHIDGINGDVDIDIMYK